MADKQNRLPNSPLVLRQIALVLISFTTIAAAQEDERPKIEPLDKWSNVFAESETRWTYRFLTQQPMKDVAVWRLTLNRRLLANGEIDLNDANQLINRTISLKWPKVEGNRIVSAQLTVAVPGAQHVRTIWLFPKDAFADRHEQLKDLKLRVFDPEGQTVECLKSANVPFERLREIGELHDLQQGIVMIGEGCHLKRYEGLMDELRKTTSHGIPVLLLASANGEFPFPDDRTDSVAAQLKKADVIRELDKRLDTSVWTKGSSQASAVRIEARSTEVVGVIADGQAGWPWCEWHIESKSGKRVLLVWCGFGIIRSWDDGPTSRFLLSAILDRLSRSTETPNLESLE